jgi:transposase
VKHCKRYRMKKADLRIQLKIRNLVDELHKKMVRCLCSNYRLILLPSFGTKRMVRTLNRKISGETARAMLTWAHYRFRKRLHSSRVRSIHGARRSYAAKHILPLHVVIVAI